MPKIRHSTQVKIRAQLAQLAARLMAEDGITNYELAKKKAARQLGLDESGSLPTNREIFAAVKAYQDLYQKQEQRDRTQALRLAALSAMALLARFNPRLTGSVLNGTAGRHAKIELHVFAENVKELEFFLLNQRIPYKTYDKKFPKGEELTSASCYALTGDDTMVEVAVLPVPKFSFTLKDPVTGKAVQHMGINELEALVTKDRTEPPIS